MPKTKKRLSDGVLLRERSGEEADYKSERKKREEDDRVTGRQGKGTNFLLGKTERMRGATILSGTAGRR